MLYPCWLLIEEAVALFHKGGEGWFSWIQLDQTIQKMSARHETAAGGGPQTGLNALQQTMKKELLTQTPKCKLNTTKLQDELM